MNPLEAVDLVELVKALCPGQKWTEHTPDAWGAVLDDVPYRDAAAAVRTLYRDRGNDAEYGPRRIEADDVLREVRRMRRARLDAGPEYQPSRHDLTALEQLAEQREHWRIIGDGGTPPTAAALPDAPHRPITRALTRGVAH